MGKNYQSRKVKQRYEGSHDIQKIEATTCKNGQ